MLGKVGSILYGGFNVASTEHENCKNGTKANCGSDYLLYIYWRDVDCKDSLC